MLGSSMVCFLVETVPGRFAFLDPNGPLGAQTDSSPKRFSRQIVLMETPPARAQL